ncbi:MAG: acetolactate synthase small subunit [Coriobacteriales bacterium]
MERYTIAVLVRNKSGVLNRVTSMFRRRRFNIDCLTVSETESPEYSRITVLFGGEENRKRQLIDQLYKLPDVVSIEELHDEGAVSRELLLIKMGNDPETRAQVRDVATAFKAKTLDYTRDSVVMQVTGTTRKIDEFINLMRDFDILEICRTGVVSLARGKSTIRRVTNL